ncbi:MAG: hypothetical protein WC450_08355 [Candidatus Omnitrophota bacterium]|jgi:hypothetical protein
MNVTKDWYRGLGRTLDIGLAPWSGDATVLPLQYLLDLQEAVPSAMHLWLQAIVDYVPFDKLFAVGTRLLCSISGAYFVAAIASDSPACRAIAASLLVQCSSQIHSAAKQLESIVENRHGDYSSVFSDRDMFSRKLLGPVFALPWVILVPDDKIRVSVLKGVSEYMREENIGAVGLRPGNDFTIQVELPGGKRQSVKMWFAGRDAEVRLYSVTNSPLNVSGEGLSSIRMSSRVDDLSVLGQHLGLTPEMSGSMIETLLGQLVFQHSD